MSYVVRVWYEQDQKTVYENLGTYETVDEATVDYDKLIMKWAETHNPKGNWDHALIEEKRIRDRDPFGVECTTNIICKYRPNDEYVRMLQLAIDNATLEALKELPESFKAYKTETSVKLYNPEKRHEVYNSPAGPIDPVWEDPKTIEKRVAEDKRRCHIEGLLKRYPMFDNIGTKYHEQILSLPIVYEEDLLDFIAECFNPESTKIDEDLRNCVIKLFGHWFLKSGRQ